MDYKMRGQSSGAGVLPYSLESERSVLGSIIIDPSSISTILEYLDFDSFYSEQNKQIFAVIMAMFSAGETIDVVTLLHRIENEKIFRDSNDAKVYLAELAETVPTSAHAESYAKIVREKQYIRDLATASKEIVRKSADGELEAEALLDLAEQKIYEIRKGKQASGLVPVASVVLETYDYLQKISGEDKDKYLGLSSGFTVLDKVLTGLNKSDLILVAGRPGMGKTSFSLNVAEHVASKTDKSVALFSLEMSASQLVSRLLSSRSEIQSQKFRTGNLSPDEWARMAEEAQILSGQKLLIDDSSMITVPEMKAKLRRVKDLGLVVIDYLQLMSTGRPSNNRVQEISEITRNLKILAKELNVPVILCSQLSRGPDSRIDHRPMLSDLRDSGSIEQDADIVMFIYRDFYYNQESEDSSLAECIIAKNRHGETSTVKLHWNGQYTRFSNLEAYRSGE